MRWSFREGAVNGESVDHIIVDDFPQFGERRSLLVQRPDGSTFSADVPAHGKSDDLALEPDDVVVADEDVTP